MLMIGKPLSTEQRLTKAVVDIMAHPRYVALAGVMMIGKREVSETVPTACTNGRDEEYGRAFVDGLTDAEFRFVVLHECYHKLYRHLMTWRHLYEDDPALANQACDYVINIKIADDNKSDGFAAMPMRNKKPIGHIDEKFRGMDAAQVYHLLKKQGNGGSAGKGGGAGKGVAGDGMDSHDWEGAKDMTVEDRKALERDIDQAIRQGALLAGKVGSGGDRDLEALMQAKVDWREALREFVSSTCTGNDYSTWRRPNRRFLHAGYYLPSGISEQVGELVVAIDTSGSIGGPELSRFLGELKGICDTVRPEAIRLLYWDTAVCQDERYSGVEVENIVQSTKPKGGGGTNVTCVPAYMTKQAIKSQAAIVLTDGYLGGGWGDPQAWGVPVLWCIVGNPSAVADHGKTIHVED